MPRRDKSVGGDESRIVKNVGKFARNVCQYIISDRSPNAIEFSQTTSQKSVQRTSEDANE